MNLPTARKVARGIFIDAPVTNQQAARSVIRKARKRRRQHVKRNRQ